MFNIVTGDESWLYNYDPDTKQPPVCVFENLHKAVKNTNKKMIAAYFRKTEIIAVISREKNDWYTEVYLSEIFNKLLCDRPVLDVRHSVTSRQCKAPNGQYNIRLFIGICSTACKGRKTFFYNHFSKCQDGVTSYCS